MPQKCSRLNPRPDCTKYFFEEFLYKECSNIFKFVRTKLRAPNLRPRLRLLRTEILVLERARLSCSCKHFGRGTVIYYIGTFLRGSTKPLFTSQNRVETRDRCYDFLNIFAEKIGGKNGLFDSEQS
jgi:hypothetical protein